MTDLNKLRTAVYALKHAMIEQDMTGEAEIVLRMRDGWQLERLVRCDRDLAFQMIDDPAKDEGPTRSLSIDGVTFRWPVRTIAWPNGDITLEPPHRLGPTLPRESR